MLLRVYLWGLDMEIQNQIRLREIENGAEFYSNWSKVQKATGIESLRVTTYGRLYYHNVPRTVEGMEKIWNGGIKLWASWINRQHPVAFMEAQASIISEKMPIYTSGKLSRLLLLGDLVCAGVVAPPTDSEMANLIVEAGSGAVTGLEILGYERDAVQVAEALHDIRQALNTELSQSVKDQFHGGEVGVFDIEHILCKVHRKQASRLTMCTLWPSNTDKQSLKRRIEGEQINDNRLRKRSKANM